MGLVPILPRWRDGNAVILAAYLNPEEVSMSAMVPNSSSTVMPAMRYRDAHGAIEWLCKVFGFEKHAVYPGPNNTVGHAELKLGGGMIMLGSEKDDAQSSRFRSPVDLGDVETRSVYIVASDVDAVHERAKAAGGNIVRELQNTDYGSREFTVRDLEGHSWSVGTYDPWAAHS